MKKIILFLSFVYVLCSCAPTEQQLQDALQKTLAVIPTATAYPTYTIAPTYTPWIKVVTATSSPTPLLTPTNTLPPTATLVPSSTYTKTSTPNPLKSIKAPGVYLVGVDIAPGVWRSQPGQEDCYWQRTTRTGDIIDNYFSFSGGTMYIAPTDFQVEMHTKCGSWTFLSNP